jgi:hypothetical protein
VYVVFIFNKNNFRASHTSSSTIYINKKNKMKKRIAILSLIAIFVSAITLSAQTPVVKSSTVKTEVKSEKKDCAKECKSMTGAEKDKCAAKCTKDASGKACAKGKDCCKVTGKSCDKKAEAGKACCKETAKSCDKKAEAGKACCKETAKVVTEKK